jgi:hypothetical protein
MDTRYIGRSGTGRPTLMLLLRWHWSKSYGSIRSRKRPIHIPANVPAKQYWSMIVYAVETAALIRDAPVVTLDSYSQTMKRNADGSVDIYFGPKAPTGKEPNWIYTAPGKAFFPAMRFYDPDKPLFDRTWKLSDIGRVSAQ